MKKTPPYLSANFTPIKFYLRQIFFIKDNVIDWPLDFTIRAGFNPDKLIGKVINHVAGIGHKIKDGFNYIVNYEANLLNLERKNQGQDKTARQTVNNFVNQHQKRIYETMKTDYPVLAQYDALLNKNSYKTGYYREKIDKNLQEITKKLLKDDQLMLQLKRRLPEIVDHIRGQTNHLKADLGRDR